MKRAGAYLSVVLLVMAGVVAPAAGNSPSRLLVQVELVSEVASVQPGVPFWVALKQQIPPGWHTYWANPGDSGEPTRLEWTLPPGVTADEISWPAPERIPIDPAMSYGYTGEVLLPVRIQPAGDLGPEDALTLSARAAWLVCEKQCIPEEATVTLTLPVSTARAAPDPQWGAAVAQARAALPRPSPWPVAVSATAETVTLSVAATGLQPERIQDAWFYPLEWGLIAYAAPQALAVSRRGLTLSVARGSLPEAVARPVEGVLVITERLDAGSVRQAFAVRAEPPATGRAAAAWSWRALLQALALALLGGLVLNLMPCVLPVLSVKALSLVTHGGSGATVMRRHGLAYTVGVLVSFAIVAGGLIALQAAGEQVGWGFQLQSPTFVTLLAYVLFVMALALSGVVTIGGRVTGLGSHLAGRSGYTGTFFTGALATLVATPCTAPFMATAVGYALTQPVPVALAVFEALGLGLALPYLALSLIPGWARFLPRPGAWMQRLQQLLAFPLYATVAWLVWVLSLQVGPTGLAACLAGLVLLGLGAWLYETTRDSTGGARGVRVVAVVCVIAAVALVALGDAPAPDTPAEQADTAIPWQPYTPDRVTELRSRGVPVFVNFTAAWCITCLVNERVALRSPEVATSFADKGVAYLKADWTRRDSEIARVLATFERSGVPLYLLYPANGAGADRPHVLPQILTERIVLEALERL